MNLLASLNIGANFFNIMLLRWESLWEINSTAEPFIKVEGKRDSPKDCLKLQISATQSICFNVTIPLINTIINVATNWSEDLKDMNLTQPIEFIPFYIQNGTGMPIEYSLTVTHNVFHSLS